jgi:hypothetical protein
MTVGHLLRAFLSLALGVAVSACGRGSEDDRVPCPRRAATFRLEVSASSGPLPADTELRVEYGASVERYDLLRGNQDNQDVCCTPWQVGDGPPASVPCNPRDASTPMEASTALRHGPSLRPPAIRCELSTNGAARIEISATGYTVIEETLEALRSDDEELQHCDALVTRDIYLELTRGDAGAPGP